MDGRGSPSPSSGSNSGPPPAPVSYGMLGYGGLPSAPATTSVLVHSAVNHHAIPSAPLPITQIPFPHSPSPIPDLTGVLPQPAPYENHPEANKTEALHPAGLLQPLEVPSQVWTDISMDFVEGLPKVNGKSVILTVVDRFSKYAHFIALGHPYTASSVARAFFADIVRLHGFPASIVSDRDPVFTGNVWRDLFKLAGVQLRLSTAFHP
ncbi:hypothetical protein E2562_038000 [Oryza meyeriana var. granulata]|uniref:Integrase catalytic domain-containing protein n=1 Tax=Oryza meyeriana var. granulata TaxID=110450 RepID=A0A6G1E984_9ORYZ|nr:hypothetical protein E2562_038000 [Oryza meyeriana var. granulata]